MRLALPLAICIGAALVQATVLPHMALAGVQPDLVMIVVCLWAALRGRAEALLWGILGGAALELFSGAPPGAALLATIAAALVANTVGTRARSGHPIIAFGGLPAGLLTSFALMLTAIALRRGTDLQFLAINAILPALSLDIVVGVAGMGIALWADRTASRR